MPPSTAGRPRLPLRPGQCPDKLALRRQRDAERYYSDDPKIRWARAALNQARARAARRGAPFGLTLVDVLGMAVSACPALGVPLSYARGRGRAYANSATLDCLLPSLGYVTGNVAVISAKANASKGRCSPEELVAIARWAAGALSMREVVAVT